MERPVAKKHDSDIDLMRLLAAYFVIICHVSGVGSAAAGMYNTLARFSVPVFVIISGYYMLEREMSVSRTLRRCLRIFARMVAVSAVFLAANLLLGNIQSIGAGFALRYLLSEPIHLWYMYAIMALCLFTPVFRVFYAHASRREYRYALGLCFLFGCIVTMAVRTGRLSLLNAVMDKSKLAYTLGMPFYYLLGGYFRRFGIEARERGALYAGGAVVTLYAVGVMLTGHRETLANFVLSFFSPNAMLSSAAVFVLLKGRSVESERTREILRRLGGCTAGIYYFHPLLQLIEGRLNWSLPLPPIVAIPLEAAILFAACLVVVYPVKAALQFRK